MCIHKNNYKNKTNLPTLPSPLLTVFATAEKLLSL